MPRLPRYRPTGKRVTYLCRLGIFSPDKPLMKPADRRELLAQLQSCCAFYGFEIFAYKCGRASLDCVVHHHGRAAKKPEAIKRIAAYYGDKAAARLTAGKTGKISAGYLETALQNYGDFSSLIKRVKGGFSLYYNQLYPEPAPRAPLWKERFRAEVVQPSAPLILAACAEVEKRHHDNTKNVTPKADPFCSFGAAMAGDSELRKTICQITGKPRWPAASKAYELQIDQSDSHPNHYGRKGVYGNLSLDKLLVTPANQPRTVPQPRSEKIPSSVHIVSLRAFKKRFGHTRVPRAWPENRLLAEWVHRCRSINRRGLLAQKTKTALKSLGFEFALQKGRQVGGKLQPELYAHDARWLEQLSKLEAYSAKHGSLDSLSSKDAELSSWLQVQRTRWRDGKLSKDRLSKLKKVERFSK